MRIHLYMSIYIYINTNAAFFFYYSNEAEVLGRFHFPFHFEFGRQKTFYAGKLFSFNNIQRKKRDGEQKYNFIYSGTYIQQQCFSVCAGFLFII